MASSDENRVRLRPGTPRSKSEPQSKRFVSQVLKRASKSGAPSKTAFGTLPSSTFGRGWVAAGMARRTLDASARRAVIKSRFVVLKKAGANSASTHLRYIERDGVTRDGKRGQGYGPDVDSADLKAFEERGRGDRHQFRFIVSVEDAEQLEDVRGYTRAFMQRLSTDLETPLDWVAVDHWDTDNPHTHIVLRGCAQSGQDLIIAPSYMAHGMRARASELATEWLGPRSELEIQRSVLREVEQQRLTGLDRELRRRAVSNVVDLTSRPGDRNRTGLLRARLQRLQAMQLAEQLDANRWRLTPAIEQTLATLGERSDILRTMNKALRGQPRELVMSQVTVGAPIVGCVVGKGLADELNDNPYLVIDAVDGRAHYLRLPAGADASAVPLGSVVQVKPSGGMRAVDRTIARTAPGGTYRPSDHLIQLEREGNHDSQALIERHVRRLEALRRSGIVARYTDGSWQIPPDLMARAQLHDERTSTAPLVKVRSPLSVAQQIRALGATWLDSQLLSDGKHIAFKGFGAQVREAMPARVDFLTEHGLAMRRGQAVVIARDLLATLRTREVTIAAAAIEQSTGLSHRALPSSGRVSGVYLHSAQLVSGRFAILQNGQSFSLVPWQPVVERRKDQSVTAVVRAGRISYDLGRQTIQDVA